MNWPIKILSQKNVKAAQSHLSSTAALVRFLVCVTQARVVREKDPQLRKMSVGTSVGAFSWLTINVGGPRPLWVMPPPRPGFLSCIKSRLCRSWIVKKPTALLPLPQLRTLSSFFLEFCPFVRGCRLSNASGPSLSKLFWSSCLLQCQKAS